MMAELTNAEAKTSTPLAIDEDEQKSSRELLLRFVQEFLNDAKSY